MPIGVDDVSAVAGIATGCVMLVQGCIKGFVLLSRAKSCHRHISNVHLKFELEQLKLYCWAEQVGLFETPAQLRLALPVAEYAPRVLNQLQGLLSDVQQLETKYGLNLEETSEEMTDIQPDDSAFAHLQLTRLPEVQRLNKNVDTIFQMKLTPWRRLRWVTIDEAHYRGLLTDIARLTGDLLTLSTLVSHKDLENTMDTLYRTAIMKNNNPRNLNMLIQSCQETFTLSALAPARLKKKSISSGFFRKVSSRGAADEELHQPVRNDGNLSKTVFKPQEAVSISKNSPEIKKLRIRYLTLPDNIQPHTTRQLAYYNDKPVLVEWRSVGRYDWERWEKRASRLCNLLNEMAQDSSFHSLPCRGFVKESETGRYGYVFEITTDACVVAHTSTQASLRKSLPVSRTLKDLIRERTSMPSLNLRISFAIVLLETILQLHTAEWMHKELRPENVLFIARSADAFLDQDLLFSSMYLVGYVYARAHGPQEFTEPLKPAVEADLYRHPLSLGNERHPYCRSFDIFGMGCVLLELALWSSMPDILDKFSNSAGYGWQRSTAPQPTNTMTPPQTPKLNEDDSSEQRDSGRLQGLRRNLLEQLINARPFYGGLLESLEGQVGRCFASIIAEFLNVQTSGWDVGAGMDESEYILDLEKRALDRLRGLAEKI